MNLIIYQSSKSVPCTEDFWRSPSKLKERHFGYRSFNFTFYSLQGLLSSAESRLLWKESIARAGHGAR